MFLEKEQEAQEGDKGKYPMLYGRRVEAKEEGSLSTLYPIQGSPIS